VDPERGRDPDRCREAALTLLERTRRTRADLSRRLRLKGYAEGVINGVLERLAEVGLVDDAQYARAFIQGRWGRRAAGWRRIEQDLRRRGVPAGDIARARAEFMTAEPSTDEDDLARRVVRQAERRYVALEPHVRRQRLYALLVRRGFDGDIIERVLRETTNHRSGEAGFEPGEAS